MDISIWVRVWAGFRIGFWQGLSRVWTRVQAEFGQGFREILARFMQRFWKDSGNSSDRFRQGLGKCLGRIWGSGKASTKGSGKGVMSVGCSYLLNCSTDFNVIWQTCRVHSQKCIFQRERSLLVRWGYMAKNISEKWLKMYEMWWCENKLLIFW